MEGLPLTEAITVNDYSQNKNLRYQNEIQTSYFDPEQGEIHVTIVYRHARKDIDDIESTEEHPHIITEQIFVISPGYVPINSNSVHVVRQHIADHFQSMEYGLTLMHEVNDNCAAQYKSRHCLLDLSYAEQDFGYAVIRIYHEPGHAKGSQDAAGGCVKRFADLAVVRGEVVIQNAEKLCTFLQDNFSEPVKKSSKLKRRKFICKEDVQFYRLAKPIKKFKIREIHSARSIGIPGKLQVRTYACYCAFCLDGQFELCDTDVGGPWREISIEEDIDPQQETEDEETDPDSAHISEQVSCGSIVAVANGEHDYKLMHITEDLHTLDSTETDDNGLALPAGADVFRACKCSVDKTLKSDTYLVVTDVSEFVEPSEIRYVCASVKDKVLKRGTFKMIKNSELDDILGVFIEEL